MGTLFIEYERLVLRAYQQKRVNNTLPHGLKHPTPANVKDECIMKCGKNIGKRDEKVVRDFCGDLNEMRTCQAIIQHCDTDKFKPLTNFLKGKSENTNSKNIELLAWLIDFPGRPWEIGKVYPDDIDENQVLSGAGATTDNLAAGADSTVDLPPAVIDNPIEKPIVPENPIIPAGPDGSNEKKNANTASAEMSNQEKLKGKSAKRLATAVILSLALGTGGMWWWTNENRLPDPNGGCMYWNEDHYEPIACNQKISNAMIIALDTVKLKNFKRITMPDTITYLAKGKVWYSKIEGKIEFYTSGGEHPVVFGRRLKPITNYMIDKYIRSGMIAK